MCECRCGMTFWCGNDSCTNSECPECRELREEMEQTAGEPDPDPAEQTMNLDGDGRR